MDYAKLLYLYLGYIWDSNTSNGVLGISCVNSYWIIQPRDRAYGSDYSPIAERSTLCLFKLDDYLRCVLPNKRLRNIRMVHFMVITIIHYLKLHTDSRVLSTSCGIFMWIYQPRDHDYSSNLFAYYWEIYSKSRA